MLVTTACMLWRRGVHLLDAPVHQTRVRLDPAAIRQRMAMRA